MRRIYNELIENNVRDLRESAVGVFYIINDEIYSDATTVRNAEAYNNKYTYGVHYDFYYDELAKYYDMPWLNDVDYDYYPRGRVIFDKDENKYILYIDPVLNTPKYISMIADEFGLHNGGFYVDTDDEHYSHTGHDVA